MAIYSVSRISLMQSTNSLKVQNAIIDGEIVCLDHQDRSVFDDLFSRPGEPFFYAFDLLWLNGQDMRGDAAYRT